MDPFGDFGALPQAAASSAVIEQPIATQRVIPWEDLGAKLVPETYLRVVPELLPSLAALMAQGPTAPVLLQADALKRLQVAADLNPVQLLAAPAAVNDAVLTVQRPASFHVGQLIRVLPVTAAGVLSATGEYHVVTAINALTIGISPNMNAGAGVGSLVVTQATVGLSTPDRKLGSFNAPVSQVTQQSFQLDPDVQGVRIIFDAVNNVAQLTLLGASGIIYQAPLQRNVAVDNIYRFPAALEGSVTVRVSTAGSGGTNVFVLAVYDVQNVVNDPRPASTQNVQLVDANNVSLQAAVIAIPYGSHTLTPFNVDINTASFKGIEVRIGVGGLPGPVTVTIQELDTSGAGSTFNILASAALGANAMARLRVYPGLPAVANASANDVVGGTTRINCVGPAMTAVNFGVDYVPLL